MTIGPLIAASTMHQDILEKSSQAGWHGCIVPTNNTYAYIFFLSIFSLNSLFRLPPCIKGIHFLLFQKVVARSPLHHGQLAAQGPSDLDDGVEPGAASFSQ